MPSKGNRTVRSTSGPHRGGFRHARRMFVSALPLFGFWLLIPLAFGLLVGLLYAIQPLVREVYSSPLSGSLQVGEWEVRFSYPRGITVDSSLLPRQAISIQAIGPSHTLPMVEVEAADGRLSLVDEEGRPLPQPFRRALSTDPTAPPVQVYLLAAPSASGDHAVLILRAASSDANQASQSIQVSVESTWLTELFGMNRQMAGMAVWGVLFSAMVGFAVQQWNRMREEQQEEERKRREALQELEELRELLQQRDYDRALRRYQVLERRDFFPWTELREAVQELWNEEAPWELQRWAQLCTSRPEKEHAPSESPGEEGTPAACREKGPNEANHVMEAILWAYRVLPSAFGSTPQVLKEQLEKKPAMLLEAERVLANDVDGRALLRSLPASVFEEVEKKGRPQEVVECSRRLQTLRRSPSPWLTLWPEDRSPDHPAVARGVRALGLQCNPFGPERAEMDPLLGEYGYRPPAIWGYLSSPQPMVILGGPGSGKTATALLLAYNCQFPIGQPLRKEILPVYLFPYETPLPVSDEASCRHLLDQVARAVAEALLQTIARHPYLFTEQNPGGQAAIASLWIACLGQGSGENLAPHLLRAGLREEGAGRNVWEKVRKLANAAIMPDETALLEFLREAKPAGFRYTEVLMDWGAEPVGPRGALIARSMEAFLKVVPALAARGVYIKAFLPRTCRPSTMGEPPVPLIELTWSEEDLREMLRRRMEYAGIESLQEVYSDVAALQPDPDAYLVQQAKGSPRSLIRLGNQMLSRIETAPLRPEHLP
ncbi:MAG: hypothetical protein ACPLYD_14680 [Anaerolineae bacterium]